MELNRLNLQKRGWFFVTRGELTYAFKIDTERPLTMRREVLSQPAATCVYDNPAAWKNVQLTDELRTVLSITAKMCYCKMLAEGRCDFCTGTRSAVIALADSDEGRFALKSARATAARWDKTTVSIWNTHTSKIETSQLANTDHSQAIWIVEPSGSFREGKLTGV